MQIAVYLGAAFLVLVAIVVILRVIVRRDYLQRGRLTPVSSASEWLLGVIWAAFSYVYLPADWPMIHVGLILRLAGRALVTLGVLIMIVSLAWLGLRRTHGLEADALVQSGPYRLTRNPQIVGFTLGMVGFVMLWPSWHMLVSLSLLVVLIHVMVLTEEEHLLDRHGDEYRRYCQHVPRYAGIPRRNQKAAG
jgi:protein-S-isoprenylcysteine O-methyltransferase Ste14